MSARGRKLTALTPREGELAEDRHCTFELPFRRQRSFVSRMLSMTCIDSKRVFSFVEKRHNLAAVPVCSTGLDYASSRLGQQEIFDLARLRFARKR